MTCSHLISLPKRHASAAAIPPLSNEWRELLRHRAINIHGFWNMLSRLLWKKTLNLFCCALISPMSSSSSPKIHDPDHSAGRCCASFPKSQRTEIAISSEDSGNKRLKGFEISVPIVYGNVAFWLGKKASEYQSHRWTVYVRPASNEDLGIVIKRVVFHLHQSFNNPTRAVETPPFELSECGWGEFEISIRLYFQSDVSDKPLNLYHHLKLYPVDESGPLSTKKPVVVESYDEIVFPEPTEGFMARAQNHPARLLSGSVSNEELNKKKRCDIKDNPLSLWFTSFSEADELLKLATARQLVQSHIAKLRRRLTLIDGQYPHLKPTDDL